MMQRFVAGAIVGGVLVWMWRDDIQRYVDKNTRRMRSKLADTLESVQETAEDVLDRAKETVSTNLESGREAILPRKS